MTPSPWALERAKDCDPLDEHEGSDVTRHRIALMLDAARLEGAKRMQERVLVELRYGVYAVPWRKCADLDPARVLAGEVD